MNGANYTLCRYHVLSRSVDALRGTLHATVWLHALLWVIHEPVCHLIP